MDIMKLALSPSVRVISSQAVAQKTKGQIPLKSVKSSNAIKYLIKSSQAANDEEIDEGCPSIPTRFVTNQDRKMNHSPSACEYSNNDSQNP